MTDQQILTITLGGPNLTLDDLRWLVARCEGFTGSSAVTVHEARDPAGEQPVDQARIHEQIIVEGRAEPRRPPTVTRTSAGRC